MKAVAGGGSAGHNAAPQGEVEARPRWLLLWVGLAGAATMIVELSAVRMVSPWFGASSGVWTNVIGVILLALAAGYLLGARWAASPQLRSRLSLALGAASLFTAALPWLAAPVCGWFMPRGLSLELAGPLFDWGSLAATCVLFLLPALSLGAVGPLAVELEARAVGRADSPGAAGGRVLCASTLGSLLGTFATTHLLLPRVGVAGTMGLSALVLGLGAVALAGRSRPRAAGLLVLSLAGAAAASRAPSGLFLPEGVELLEARESPYQSVRAVSDRRGPEELRLLQVNEGLDSFQSVWKARPGALGPGYYYDAFALPPWWSGRREGSWRVAILGLGAGTTFRVLEGAAPQGLSIDAVGVEIDAVVVEVGRRWFDLPAAGSGGRVVSGVDARSALRTWENGFDQIVLDAYAHQMEIPAHLCSREAFLEMREKLAPGGWLSINLGGFGFEDPLLVAVAATAASAFDGPVLVLRIGGARNFVVFARNGVRPVDPRDVDAPRPCLELVHLWGPAQLDGGARWVAATDGPWLSDDLNPIDLLQRRSLAEASRARP
ncbi:MAG: fused MFS/spermidine synthase [Planctomycetes bacterium]|nr:fused MFS/spermidine synthase [Planctomycetota bacterium]